MDRTTIAAVEDMTRMGLDTEAGALLLAQSDGAGAADDVGRCAAACEAAGATYVAHTADPTEGDQFLEARRLALPALERQGTTLLDDVAVPKPAIPAMLAAVEAAARRHGVVVGTFGHAGDGNLHPTIAYDPADPESVLASRLAFDEIVAAAVSLGGTITGEHGVGLLKLPYVGAVVGRVERDLMARVKQAFDPAGILNPGKGY
jgi:D-lactate dehydrogenase (cytochrome)/glycolate oxidase